MTPVVIGWTAIVAIASAGLFGLGAVLLRRSRLGERRERWQDQTIGPASALFNALFLASFALSAVLALQNHDHAQQHVAQESQALAALYEHAGELPGAPTLRAEVANYVNTVVRDEWPLLPYGRSAEAADRQVVDLSDQLIAIQPANASVSAARAQAMTDLNGLIAARAQRLLDTTTTVPVGLLLGLVVMAVVVLSHALVVGLPHTTPSLISLLTEAALIGGAVFVVFSIRQPYHGAVPLSADPLSDLLGKLTVRP